jgi:hypothetical protein
MPPYYRHLLANGKTVMETAPTIQWGYLIYLTVLRLCQYFGAKEECRFCDINHNWRQHKRAGRPYTGIKPVEDVLEALKIIDEHDDGASHAYAHRRVGDEHRRRPCRADFYGRYAQAIEERFPGGGSARWSHRRSRARTSSATRTTGFHLPPELRGLGRAPLLDHLPGEGALRGEKRVAPADPRRGGSVRPAPCDPELRRRIELARPFGFTTVDEAIASTVEGLDYFMSRGITPRFTTWCPEPTTPLGRDNPRARRSSTMRLLEAYRETLERHGLRPPPGYGKPGAGNAVFSVSSFMDVLAPEVVPV